MLDKDKGPLYQAGCGPRHRAWSQQQAVQQAAVKAEVRRGHDRHHALADRSGAGAGPQCQWQVRRQCGHGIMGKSFPDGGLLRYRK